MDTKSETSEISENSETKRVEGLSAQGRTSMQGIETDPGQPDLDKADLNAEASKPEADATQEVDPDPKNTSDDMPTTYSIPVTEHQRRPVGMGEKGGRDIVERSPGAPERKSYSPEGNNPDPEDQEGRPSRFERGG